MPNSWCVSIPRLTSGIPDWPSPTFGQWRGFFGRCVSEDASQPSYPKGTGCRPPGVGPNGYTTIRIVRSPKL